MTEEENPTLRDGTNQDSAGGDGEDPTEEEPHILSGSIGSPVFAICNSFSFLSGDKHPHKG